MTTIIIAGTAFLFLLLFFIYNSLISKKNQVNNAYAGIDAQLKKRYDLLPNIISAVKKYMEHEKEVLTELTELRTQALNCQNEVQSMQLNSKLNQKLNGLLVSVENYPELKSSQNFIQLQNTLYDIEEQLAAARRAFNAAVTDYNNALEMFPSNIVANLLGYKRKHLFEISDIERKNINVANLLNS